MMKNTELKNYIWIIVGAVLLGFGFKNLYDPCRLVTGGFSGIAIIVKDILNIPLWITNTVLNIPVFLLAYWKLGWKFIKRSLVGTIALSASLAVLPQMSFLADDVLLSAISGGVLCGIGMGLIFNSQGTTGGTDMVAALIRLKLKHRSMNEILQVIDAVIIIAGMSLFGIKQALYALIAIFIVAKVSDRVMEGPRSSKQVYIISDKYDEIQKRILYDIQRGVTAIEGTGAYSGEPRKILFCVVPKKEIAKVKELVRDIDSHAFVIVSDAREVFGMGFVPVKDSMTTTT